MRKPITVKSSLDQAIMKLADRAEHVTLATWACDCADRVLGLFENAYPEDVRPREAIAAGRAWIKTRVFKMAVIRAAALAAHAAARQAPEYTAARAAARASGQAAASAHADRHALAAAIYAATAIRNAMLSSAADIEPAVLKERIWQYRRLKTLLQRGVRNYARRSRTARR